MRYEKKDLEKYILTDNLSYEKIGRIYNVTSTSIKKAAKKYEIKLPVRAVFPNNFIPANKGKIPEKNICIFCGKVIKKNRKYCSSKCKKEHDNNIAYTNFLYDNDKFCRPNYSPRRFKDIFLKEQNNVCAICENPPIWNNKKIVFILDHIDGNAGNNKRENLRLVCPNCDSQLDTYKSRNKNSARKERYLLSYKKYGDFYESSNDINTSIV